MVGINDTNILIPTYASFSITVFCWILDGCEDICFPHFSYEKQISLHRSEAVLGFLNGVTMSIIIFSHLFSPLGITIITNTLSNKDELSYVTCPSTVCHHGEHGVSPPPVQNQAKTRCVLGGLRQNGYRWLAGVSAHHIK